MKDYERLISSKKYPAIIDRFPYYLSNGSEAIFVVGGFRSEWIDAAYLIFHLIRGQ